MILKAMSQVQKCAFAIIGTGETASPNPAHSICIRQDNSFVSTYLHSIHNIADELALIGHSIDNLEMVIHALNGFGPTIKEFTTSIRTHDSPIAFNELYEIFLEHEDVSQNRFLPLPILLSAITIVMVEDAIKLVVAIIIMVMLLLFPTPRSQYSIILSFVSTVRNLVT